MRRGITAEIDLSAAAYNLAAIKKEVNDLPIIAVVKADAYGHGALEISRLFQKEGVSSLAVAFLSEAEELRDSGITLPILVLFDRTDIERYFDLQLTPVIHDLKTAEAFSKEASRRNLTLDIHVKVNTGMNRMGLDDSKGVEKIADLPSLRITGLMSHLSEADLAEREFVNLQVSRFIRIRDELSLKGIKTPVHIANSAATLSMKNSHLDSVRPGLALYGCSPFERNPDGTPELKPVMTARARIAALRKIAKGQPVSYGRTFIVGRDTLGAVLAVGYADGYMRSLSNNADVLIRGKRAPILGKVCMDLVVVDVTDIEGVAESDEVVLLGRVGSEEITYWELARNASTIPYEIMTSLGHCCTERIYKGHG